MLTAADVLRDLRGDIAAAAGDRDWRDTREVWLGRAASRLRQPFSRIKSPWYDARSNPSAAEYLNIRAAAAALRASNNAALEIADENDARIARLLARPAVGPAVGRSGPAGSQGQHLARGMGGADGTSGAEG